MALSLDFRRMQGFTRSKMVSEATLRIDRVSKAAGRRRLPSVHTPQMDFFFPDSQDQVDPSFDFEREVSSPIRVRQRDDLYAHEIVRPAPYNGVLLSRL